MESSGIDNVNLPSSAEAERAVLGAILVDNDLFYEALGLFAQDFHIEAHQLIYRCMRAMREQGFVIDQITLAEHLSRQKELEAVGGKTYLESLAEGLPQRLSIESYCRIVKDKSLLREIIQASTAAVYHAADDSDTALEVVNELESRIMGISTRGTKGGFARIGDIVAKSFGSIDELYKSRRDITGLATHFRDFNRITCGLQPSDLIIIAARPSMGKTAWAINIAQRVATYSNRSVGIFSLECPKRPCFAACWLRNQW